MRLINADAFLDDVTKRHCKDCDMRKGIKNGKYRTLYSIGEAPCRACDVDDLKAEIEDTPTIQLDPDTVSRQDGHWEMLQIPINPPIYKCAVCGGHTQNLTNFCPNCGADMRGGAV